MSDGFNVTANVTMTPPRDPAELRARAIELLRARLEEILSDLRDRPPQAPGAERTGQIER